jgi:hypothetical protein
VQLSLEETHSDQSEKKHGEEEKESYKEERWQGGDETVNLQKPKDVRKLNMKLSRVNTQDYEKKSLTIARMDGLRFMRRNGFKACATRNTLTLFDSPVISCSHATTNTTVSIMFHPDFK